MIAIKDSQGLEWHPVFDAESIFSWTRANGLTIEQLTNIRSLPLSAIVDALWWTCRFEVQNSLPKVGKQDFLKRFSAAETMSAVEGIITALADSLPEGKESDGEDPLSAEPTTGMLVEF